MSKSDDGQDQQPDGQPSVVVFETEREVELNLVTGWLNVHGFEATSIAFSTGWGPISKVMVPANFEQQARDALRALFDRAPAGRLSLAEPASGELSLAQGPNNPVSLTQTPSCAKCHETWEPGYDVCWNCLHEQAEVAPVDTETAK